MVFNIFMMIRIGIESGFNILILRRLVLEFESRLSIFLMGFSVKVRLKGLKGFMFINKLVKVQFIIMMLGYPVCLFST